MLAHVQRQSVMALYVACLFQLCRGPLCDGHEKTPYLQANKTKQRTSTQLLGNQYKDIK